MGIVTGSIFLTALARTIRGDLRFQVERRKLAFKLGREVYMPDHKSSDSAARTIHLNAALSLCVELDASDGLLWAEQIWAATATHIARSSISYETFTQVL